MRRTTTRTTSVEAPSNDRKKLPQQCDSSVSEMMLSAGNMSVDVVTYVIKGAPPVARCQVQRAGLNGPEKTMGALSATGRS